MFFRLTVMAGLGAITALAQFGSGGYGGPSILSKGASGIGTRSGQQVDLRFFASVNAVYDNGYLPVSSDSKGQPIDVGGQTGVSGSIGAYGSHSWRRALLGLDYSGGYTHYSQDSYFDGSQQTLSLGYTYQKSRKLSFDMRAGAGTYSRAFSGGFGYAPAALTPGFDAPTGLLFDNRSTFLQVSMQVTYAMSPRNSFTAGGDFNEVIRQSKALIGMNGYSLFGGFEHHLSAESSVGVNYRHYHYDYPRAFGESDIDEFTGSYTRSFDRKRWTFRISGGALQAQVQGLQTVTLDPVIANILGVGTTTQTYFAKTLAPTGAAGLSRHFRNSNLDFNYSRGITPGNGVYLTSKSESAGAGYSYSGIRQASLSVGGNFTKYASLGQTLGVYSTYGATASASYNLSHSLHLVASYYTYRRKVEATSFKKNSSSMTFGISFSPGDIPLSFW